MRPFTIEKYVATTAIGGFSYAIAYTFTDTTINYITKKVDYNSPIVPIIEVITGGLAGGIILPLTPVWGPIMLARIGRDKYCALKPVSSKESS